MGIQCTFFLTNNALTWKDRLHITSRKKGLLLIKFLRVEQIILLIVIVCNSSRISWSYFSLFVLKRCQHVLFNVWNFNVLIALSVISLSICSSFHLKSFIIFCLHFLCFSYCFPFSRNVRTSKKCARVENEPLCFKRLLGRSNS